MACEGTATDFGNWNDPLSNSSPFPLTGFLSGFMVEIFLYGINLSTFSTAAITLIYNLKCYVRWILLAFATVMFSISTATASLNFYILFGYLIRKQPVPFQIFRIRQILYLVNNLIADVLLIYRSYVIWSHSARIIIVPCIFLSASFGLGILYIQSPLAWIRERGYVYMWLTLAFNTIITALNASRIWWMAREARKILGPTLAQRYYSAMVIIIESGAIYSLYILADQVIKTVVNQNITILDAGLTQVVAIAPTLIIVQVSLDRQARDLESAIRTSRETEIVFTTVHSQ
ncbi:hypothetical protein D9756_003061 [Leucocoprinus leucothites]|uniref:Uncharacterized protein n=1 Tax=Leucocoprinus leucothites TaxID=201217 RepID=A0A8H5LJG3_9AGAR|nr:hypothetical protein D9756_003061 [Leucoagaricus leucothites]